MKSAIGRFLDGAATIALAVSIVLVGVVLVDLFTPLAGTIGTDHDRLRRLTRASVLLILLFAPTVFAAILWPIHLRQKRSGAKVFWWVRFVVLASAIWTGVVFLALSRP